MDQEQRSSRIVYPKLPATFTEIDLPRLFGVTSEEWAWARTVARRGPPQRLMRRIVCCPCTPEFSRKLLSASVPTALTRGLTVAILLRSQRQR
jgi:hypothetical protein